MITSACLATQSTNLLKTEAPKQHRAGSSGSPHPCSRACIQAMQHRYVLFMAVPLPDYLQLTGSLSKTKVAPVLLAIGTGLCGKQT